MKKLHNRYELIKHLVITINNCNSVNVGLRIKFYCQIDLKKRSIQILCLKTMLPFKNKTIRIG